MTTHPSSPDEVAHLRERLAQLERDHTEIQHRLHHEQRERERAEEALRMSEERFRSVVEKTPAGICITNEDGIYEYVNPAYCKLYQYAPEELIGQPFTMVVPRELQAFMTDLHDQFLQGQEEVQGEWQVVTRDGTTMTILAEAARIIGQDGKYKKATFVMDITNRKDTEETLHNQNMYLNMLHQVTLGLLRRLDLDSLLKAIVDRASKLVNTSHGYIYLLEPGEDDMRLRVGIGVHADTTEYRVKKGKGVAGIVWETGQTLLVDDYRTWSGRPDEFTDTVLRSVIGVPLMSGSEVIGVIGLTYVEEDRTFGTAESKILERFAELASIGLDNARLYSMAQREIAERKQTEATLRLLDGAVHYSTECVLITDAELDSPGPRIVFVNPAFTALTGYTAEEALGQTPRLLQGPKTDRAMLDRLKQTLKQGQPFSAETTNYRKDGTEYVVEWRIAPIRNEQGEITHWVSVQHDTTERKRVEEVRARLVAILEATTDMVGTFNTDGTPLYLNRAWKRLLGLQEETNLTALSLHNFYPPWALRIITENAFPTALRDGAWSGETALLTSTGAPIPVSEVVIAHRNSDGNIEYLSTIARDISEPKRVEQELRDARQSAEAASQAKSMFLSRMSHELRTPLNAILGFVQLMVRDVTLSSQHQENLAIIERSGEHLLKLINDVLEISRIEAGQETLQEHGFDLRRLLDGLHDMFDVRARQKGLSLGVETDDNLPQYVYGDESKLRQVLINLLGNAIKFTNEGGIAVSVTCARRETPQQASDNAPPPPGEDASAPSDSITLHFQVEDTGYGIDPEEMELLFEDFSQTQSGRNVQEGTGLGLSISRAFVRMMGGDIHVRSEAGKGSVFTFDVQMMLADSAIQDGSLPMQQVIGLEPGQPAYRILVADDKWENRIVLVKLLETVGFEVREATNGHEAVAICESWQPHLVWMDMRMPLMDGYEATSRIKAMPNGDQTPVIALTASAFEHERSHIFEAGCNDFVPKPFRESVIFEKMAHYLPVRFIYKKDEQRSEERSGKSTRPPAPRDAQGGIQGQQPSEQTAEPTSLAHLPADVVRDLQQAATTLNRRKAQEAIERIRVHNSVLADNLMDAVKQYRFDTILALIEQET
jgi:PAS domain S-box-containing protein